MSRIRFWELILLTTILYNTYSILYFLYIFFYFMSYTCNFYFVLYIIFVYL